MMTAAFKSLAALQGGNKLLSLVDTHQTIMDTFEQSDGYREPSRTYKALCDFAEHHELRSLRTRQALEALKADATSHARRYAFGVLLRELQRLRFVEPQTALVIVQAGDVVAAEQEEVLTQTTFKMWTVDESIWRPRKQWSDGRSFDDTVEVFTAVFTADWREAASSPALAIYASEDLAAASEVMWESHRLVLMASDWYSMWYSGHTLPTNIFRVGRNAFKALINDIGVVRPKSQTHSLASFDGIFLLITGASAQDPESREAAFDATPALNRMEFMQSVVRMADMTYLKSNESPSLAEALRKLLSENLSPVISATFKYVLTRPRLYSTAFRGCCCYTRDCSAIIEENLPTIKGLFERYSLSEKDGADAGLRGSMSYEEFNRFIKDFGLNDHIFTPRESTLAFVWSRMRVIDDGRSKRGRHPICSTSPSHDYTHTPSKSLLVHIHTRLLHVRNPT